MDEGKMLSELMDSMSKIESHSEVVFNKANQSQDEAILKDRKDVHTRSNLTIIFLFGFFFILILSAVFVWWYNNSVVHWTLSLNQQGLAEEVRSIHFLELDKVLSIVISALGTSLGFIIGYYFKDKNA